jgi:hypothetical protein
MLLSEMDEQLNHAHQLQCHLIIAELAYLAAELASFWAPKVLKIWDKSVLSGGMQKRPQVSRQNYGLN